MRQLKIAAVWMVGKLLAFVILLVTSIASCIATFHISSIIFFPEQTEFPNGVPPASFLVVVENRGDQRPDEAYRTVRWQNIDTFRAKKPDAFRLSTKVSSSQNGDHWNYRVIEESPSHQIIVLSYRNTVSIKTRYRVEGDTITPLSYKTDGGVGLGMVLMPVFAACLWLGLIAARRGTRWVKPALTAIRGNATEG